MSSWAIATLYDDQLGKRLSLLLQFSAASKFLVHIDWTMGGYDRDAPQRSCKPPLLNTCYPWDLQAKVVHPGHSLDIAVAHTSSISHADECFYVILELLAFLSIMPMVIMVSAILFLISHVKRGQHSPCPQLVFLILISINIYARGGISKE